LLDALIAQRKSDKFDYEKYLADIVALAKKAQNPTEGATYPASLNSPAKRALYDNLAKNEKLALASIRKSGPRKRTIGGVINSRKEKYEMPFVRTSPTMYNPTSYLTSS